MEKSAGIPGAASQCGPADGCTEQGNPTVMSRRDLPKWRRYVNRIISAELSAITRFYDRLIQVSPRPDDTGYLLSLIDCPRKQTVASIEEFPSLRNEADTRTAVLVNGNFNHDYDIQGTLEKLRWNLSRTSRICVVAYNPYLRLLYWLANILRLRKGPLPETFVTRTDFENIAALAGFEVVRYRFMGYCPIPLLGLGTVLNRVLPTIPLLRWFHLAALVVLRPRIPSAKRPSLSIVIPCRNERGNIEPALKRLPRMEGTDVEVIFVEGHSSDGTWEEIQRLVPAYAAILPIRAAQQTGKGKNDAVRLGFSLATGDLLTILDADLTMPPELLPRFYEAWCQGHADFINGSRLVYPMEGEAMRFLNRLGNIFFSKALSHVLGTKLGDSLCGTKLVARHDYRRIRAWRDDFGDFDPFGDYELLFPAAGIALGIIDVPIRYRARSYGSTNISRFSHGLMLLRMTIFGFFHLSLGKSPRTPAAPGGQRHP